MASELAAEATEIVSMVGKVVTQSAKQYGGAVVSDIKTAIVPDAFKKLAIRRKKDDELCHTCRKLDLVKLFNDMSPVLDQLDERILIGTYDEIVTRTHCPFCRLVLSAVNNSLRDPIQPGYRTAEGEAVCCLLRRRHANIRFLWRRNLKVELRSIPVKSLFSKSKLNWKLGWENDMRTDNNFVPGIIQDCDAQIIVHNDSAAKYPFPPLLDKKNKHNHSSKGDAHLDLEASHEAGWWLDPFPLLGCTPESTFDVQKLLVWHKSCTDCSKFDLTLPNPTRLVELPGMLLIDTNTMNLVPAPVGVAYAALSYVWGKLKDPFRATKANRDELMAEGGLLRAPLPRTIREAIEVIKSVGFRYFWVDAICIIQDDLEVLMTQITAMDTIYKGASLTLVAAGNNSADDPLDNSKHQIHAEVFGDLTLMARNRSLEATFGRSTWNSRAWCFQEKILSGKMLIYTQEEVYYDCSHFIWSESMESPDQKTDYSASLKKSVYANPDDEQTRRSKKGTKSSNPWLDWTPMKFTVEEYTSRSLTDENDILSAIWGVLKSISPDLTNMVGGSPLPYLIYTLLWRPIGPHYRRSTTKVPYPSWSWLGWISSKQFPELWDLESPYWFEIRDFATSRSTIVTSWYFRDSRSCEAPRHLQNVIQLDHRHPKEMKEYRAQKLEMIGQENVIAKTKNLTAAQLEQLQNAEVILLKESSGSYAFALKSEYSLSDQQEHVQSSPSYHDMPDNGVLQFWTESAFFRVRQTQENNSGSPIDAVSCSQFKIVDSADRWIGMVQLPNNWLGKDKECEFIILSTNLVACSLEGEDLLHEMPKWRKVKAQMKMMGDPTYTAVYFYDVLVIEWKYGIAYRVGLGSIYFDDWDLANPVQKLVTLG
ncbi:heterokaryon incompatibility protein-domain-containing protein [Xylogone sp. PMI_703]|nr:heterokaryon incompatibility protein-domain-containing protein [Xylogone sp. PMI_703]